MDEKEPEDKDVKRLWIIALIAKEFGVLPTVVAEDLDNDPEMLSWKCIPLLRYADAKIAFDTAKDEKSLTAWEGSKIMEAVMMNTFQLRKEEFQKLRNAREKS